MRDAIHIQTRRRGETVRIGEEIAATVLGLHGNQIEIWIAG